MKDGTPSLRDKELIALAIAVHATCAPCIRLHVRKCLDAGATRDQMIEEVSVAVMIGSGPAYL
jgi:AhpD family alkylhydroperoxidase